MNNFAPAVTALLTAGILGFAVLSGPPSQENNPTKNTPKVVHHESSTPVVNATGYRSSGRNMTVSLTSYNSLPEQTDSTPNITSTGTRTRPGVLAVSRELRYLYHKKVRIESVTGRNCGVPANYFAGRIFYVEDTMNARFRNKVDVWVPTLREAYRIGHCTANIRILG